jgi:hypothetical protein
MRIDLCALQRVSAFDLNPTVTALRPGSVGTQIPLIRLPQSGTEALMKRSLLCFGFLMILGGSGLAQMDRTAPAFYVVLNSLTKSCTVADKLPRTDTPNITVASDTVYKTRAEAETAIKTLKPCNP